MNGFFFVVNICGEISAHLTGYGNENIWERIDLLTHIKAGMQKQNKRILLSKSLLGKQLKPLFFYLVHLLSIYSLG